MTNVTYGGTSGPAGELTALKYAAAGPGHQWYNETRTFNVRGQLTRMTATGVADTGYTTPQTVDLQYNFSGTANDGRLTSRQDLVSGEAVNYTFDTLGRLTYANNTGTSPWSQTFTYDGFGNLLTETGSGGAPTKMLSVDPTTNRINSSGYSFDAAGNLTAMPGITSMVYDKSNRLSQATVAGGTEKYGYNPAGQRAWMQSTSGVFTVYFYGVKGELLATYHHDYGSCHCTAAAGPYVYFAGKKIWDGAGMVEDRLGSKLETSGASAASYYPYGELKSGTASQFATYQRQSATGLDYAQQRWYSSQVMRFTNPDPDHASGKRGRPQSWNRYLYAQGDPVNRKDPSGLGSITVVSCQGGNQAALSVGGSGFTCPDQNYSLIGQSSPEMTAAYANYETNLGVAYAAIDLENSLVQQVTWTPSLSIVTSTIDFGNGPQDETGTVTSLPLASPSSDLVAVLGDTKGEDTNDQPQSAATGSLGFFSQYYGIGGLFNVAYVPATSTACLGLSFGIGTPGLSWGAGTVTSDAGLNVVNIVEGISVNGSYSGPYQGGGQFSWTPGTGVANGPAWGGPGASLTVGGSICGPYIP